MGPRILSGLVLGLAATSAAAALHGRLPATPGGSDYQAYYDDVLGITWLADANRAQSSGYDSDGRMSWTAAQAWISSLNAAQHLGAQGWRLPTITDNGGPGCNFSYNGTDCGYNVNTSLNEMANLYDPTLGNLAAYTTAGAARPCASAAPNYCLGNPGPFSHLQPAEYWSWREYREDTAQAWDFSFGSGAQLDHLKTSEFYAWAVHDGDLDPDQDGIAEAEDNCTLAANPTQFDGDGDGYGNRCDGDLNNNGVTNAQDYAIFRSKLGSADPAADLNGNSTVNAQDYAIFRTLLGVAPGPSAVCVHGGSGSCPWQTGDAFTRTQLGWDAGTAWHAAYDSIYASTFGIVEVGIPGTAGFSMRFTGPDAVNNYLLQTGTAGALTSDVVDPTSTSSGGFGGDAISLRLNIDFSAAGALGGAVTFGQLSLCAMTDTALNGKTVSDIMGIANTLLGGGANGYTIPAVTDLVGQLNFAFADGAPSAFAMSHLVNGSCH